MSIGHNMMKKITLIFLSIALTLVLSAQDSTKKRVEIVTKDGNTIIGNIVSESDQEIIIFSETLGSLTFQRDNIKVLNYLDTEQKDLNSEYRIDYHNSTRYLVTPSGYGLKKGQQYYENIGIFFNSYAIGISDNFSVAAGGEVASFLFGQQFPIIYISPKFSTEFKEGKGAWGIGTTLFSSPSDDFNGFGFVNTSLTIGSRNNNFTIGGGIGFSTNDGFTDEILPLFASFMIRLSEKTSLISDNFVILYDDNSNVTGVLSIAIRKHFKKMGTAINFGLWRPTEDTGDLIAIPFVSATIPLNK